MDSKNFLTRLFENYIYSGRKWVPVEGRQVSFINGFSIIGITAAVCFGVYRVFTGETFGYAEIIWGVIGVLNVWHLRKSFNTDRASHVILILMVVMIAFLFVDGGIAGTGIFWAFTFPVLAFFLFDEKVGLWWCAGLLLFLGLISLSSVFGGIEIHYHWIVLRQVLFSFLAVVGLLYFYSLFSSVNAKIFTERSHELKESFNEEKEKIETEARSKESRLKGRLENFFQTSGEIMGLGNAAGYFVEVNPAFTKILGYTTEEALKTPFMGFVHPDDFKNAADKFAKVILGDVIENFSFRMKRKDGEYVWVMWNARFSDGVIYIVGHLVNDLVVTQETLKKKLDELERLNHIMIGRELTMIELKNEIAALKGEKSSFTE